MKDDNAKNPAQIMLTKDEYVTVKVVSIKRGFSSVNRYLRSLVERDVVDYKKSSPVPWTVGMSLHEWERLSEPEREQYLNRIGTVKPSSFEDFIEQKRAGVNGDMGNYKNDLGL